MTNIESTSKKPEKSFVPTYEVLGWMLSRPYKADSMEYTLSDGKAVILYTDGNICWYIDEFGDKVIGVYG